jgi:hypothetical protein
MKKLLDKLNYKDHRRIAIINAEPKFLREASKELIGIIIDSEIDQRCPYEFIILFVRSASEVNLLAPKVLHNLTANGVLWLCYPKKSLKLFSTGLERDRGWRSTLNNLGFYGIRMVSIDEDWSAVRFRNKKYIKSTSSRLPKKSA